MFSKTCEYGIRAVMYIAQESDKANKVGLNEIATAIDSPEAFTAKVLQKLTKKAIIKSTKGPYGGFFIEKEKLQTTFLNDLIQIFEGENAYKGCAMGLSFCDAQNPCPMHQAIYPISNDLSKCLESNSLHDILYQDGELKTTYLKR